MRATVNVKHRPWDEALHFPGQFSVAYAPKDSASALLSALTALQPYSFVDSTHARSTYFVALTKQCAKYRGDALIENRQPRSKSLIVRTKLDLPLRRTRF
jgi:hypothetical protein